jgi:hypothetical protein
MDSLEEALEEFKRKLDDYERTFRHPDRKRFDRSGLYALSPETTVPTEKHWDEEWPNSNRAGIYVIFGNSRVLYVGKARKLGRRLACYFQYEFPRAGNKCRIIHDGCWKEKPLYVATVAVPDDSKFEAASLEEYLIEKLHPCDNTLGRLPDAVSP